MRTATLLLIAILLAGCSGSPASPTPSATGIPAESTPEIATAPASATAPSIVATKLAREADGSSALVVDFRGDGAYRWQVATDAGPAGEATTGEGEAVARIPLIQPVPDSATTWSATLSVLAGGGASPLLTKELSFQGATQILQLHDLTWGNRGLIALTLDTRHTGEIPHEAAKVHVAFGARNADWSIEAANRTFDVGNTSRRIVGFALPVFPIASNLSISLRTAGNDEIASASAQLPAPAIEVSGLHGEITCDESGSCTIARLDLNVTSLSATPTYVSHWYVTWNGTTQDVVMAPLGFYNSRHAQAESLALTTKTSAPRGQNEDVTLVGKDVNGATVAHVNAVIVV